MSLAAALLVALAIAVAPAAAQEPSPSPTATPSPSPTATPTPERSKAERAVYRDYRRDGVIDACDHKRRTLREVLRELPPEADVDNPDLRPALEAAIDQHDDGDCDEPEPEPTATATPAPTATAAPTAAPDTGSVDPLPPATGGGTSPPPSTPPDRGDVDPLPEVTPVPPAQTPVPATPPPAEPSGPEVTPAPVYANADDAVPVSLLVLAALLALLALLALAFAAAGRFGWAERYVSGPRRAFREAAFRAGGTWADFADWLRFGR